MSCLLWFMPYNVYLMFISSDPIVNNIIYSRIYVMCSTNGMQQMGNVDPLSSLWPTNSIGNNAIRKQESVNTNVEQLLAQMHDLSFMLKDELSVPDKPVEHSKP